MWRLEPVKFLRMRIRAILFDLDDTLVIETPLVEAAFVAACEPACERHGIDPRALASSVRSHSELLWEGSPVTERCRTIGMSSWEALWAAFGGAAPDERRMRSWSRSYRRDAWLLALREHGIDDAALAEDLAEAFCRERRARNIPFPEAVEVLSALRSGFGLGLVTNGVGDHQREKLVAAGLSQFIEVFVCSGDLGVGKPDPRMFAAATAALGVPASETIMVGNSLRRDIAGAQAAGIRAVWVNRGGAPRSGGVVPDAEIRDLRELRGLLDVWTGPGEGPVRA